MREVLEDVRSEIRGAWRFRWLAMGLAWLICLAGWSAVFLMPDKYAAEAKFYVDPTSRIQDIMKGIVVDDDEASQLAVVREIMLSRRILEQVARDTDLDLRARTPLEKEALVDTLRRTVKIDVDSVGRRRRNAGNLYHIQFQDVDRGMARAVVSAMLEEFEQVFKLGQMDSTGNAVAFLEQQVAEYQARLQEKERAVANFKRENVGLLPGEGGGYFENLQSAMSELQTLETQLKVATNRRDALRAQLKAGVPDSAGEASDTRSVITTPRTELEQRIVELEEVLDSLLLSYTDRHPDVVATRVRLDQLYDRRAAELEAVREAGGTDVPVSDNPVVQEMQIALNEADIVIADLEGQVAAQRLRVVDLQAKVDIIPVREAELADLTRDYNQVQRTYAELLERLEQESLFDAKGEFERDGFQEVQAPVASLEPVAPNRPRLLVMVMFGALLAAAGLAYLLHLFKPVFVDPRSLRQVTGLPVLGAVSMAWVSQRRTKRWLEAGSIGFVCVTLILALVVVLVFQDAGVEAGARIRRMALL